DRLATFRERGTEVTVARGDVTDEERMRAILDEVRRDGTLRGTFHLAGVLDDATIPNQTPESLRRAFGPKAVGAWHLHTLTYDDPLDYFVLFSSAATVIGSPGQSNYAAANEFLDALACARRGDGRPALSIDWGGWTDVGLAAARDDRGARLEKRGLVGITPQRGLEALERALLRQLPPQIGIFGMDWQTWSEGFPHVRDDATYSELCDDDSEAGESDEVGAELVDAIRETDDHEPLVADYLRRQVANVLGRSASTIDFGQPVSRIGLDSLMVVELRVRLEDQLGIELSRDSILTASGLEQLTDEIVDELDRL
ncbi:MAG: beta-ketoacyl reductase, partial [Bradymonadaceae bacterium]